MGTARNGKDYNRQDIIERDTKPGEMLPRCWICLQLIDLDLKTPHPLSFTLDHIIPKSKGGPNVHRNVASCHQACNERRASKNPDEYLTGLEGLLYYKNGKSAILLHFNNDDELEYVIQKLSQTRFKHLKRIMVGIKIFLQEVI